MFESIRMMTLFCPSLSPMSLKVGPKVSISLDRVPTLLYGAPAA